MCPAPAQPQKTVHLIPRDSAIKRLCFDETTRTLRPNLALVDKQGQVVFEINELGLKGAARDPARRLVVVWGDSVVFGFRWSWPCLLDALAPGYQFLNGGIEADPFDNILRRAAAFNREHDVAFNVLLLGWHPIPATPAPGNGTHSSMLQRIAGRFRSTVPALVPVRDAHQREQVRTALTAFLQNVPNTALVTMPTPLNPKIANQDLSGHLIDGDRDTVFSFAGDMPYSLAVQRHLFEHITERNAVVREVASAANARLIDLAAEFDTEQLDDFRRDFHDVLHLRPRVYPRTADRVYAGIKDLLP